MTQPLSDLPVFGSPARGQLTLRIPTNATSDLAERFVDALEQGRVEDVTLFNFVEPDVANYQSGPSIPLRDVTLVSREKFVDYRALDAIDFKTWEVIPAREEDRWMAEMVYAYLDVVVEVSEQDWSAVERLLGECGNLHLAVTLSVA